MAGVVDGVGTDAGAVEFAEELDVLELGDGVAPFRAAVGFQFGGGGVVAVDVGAGPADEKALAEVAQPPVADIEVRIEEFA